MDANIKNAPNKVTTIATGLSVQYGATGSCECLAFAWYCSGVCFQANRPHNNKNAPIRNAPTLYINYLLRKKNLIPMSKEIAIKIYSSISLNGAFEYLGIKNTKAINTHTMYPIRTIVEKDTYSILKFNNNNKLLSQNIYQSVYSNMNIGADA